jgi:hypothetical protein
MTSSLLLGSDRTSPGRQRALKKRVVALLTTAACFAASSQPLPRINVIPASNHTLGISWPYTNSSFQLEESASLPSNSNWQSSLLSPAFNSSGTLFSVSAGISNSARFFRLSRPVDLRGIYVYVPLDVATNAPAAAPVKSALALPGVDGMLIVGLWSSIETNLNLYDWTHLDHWISYGIASHKKIDISIRSGDGIPDWLFLSPTNGGAGATPLIFTISPKDGKTGNCQQETNAIPWEPAFLDAWNALLTNLSAHLTIMGTYSNVTLLRLTGINRTSDELRLPAQTADTNSLTGTGLSCVSNAPAIWQTNGYRPSKLLFAWSNIITSFKTNFPDKAFCVAIIPNPPQVPFPPIDENGQLITNNLPDQNQPLLQLASQMLPGRFVVQFNFLMTSNAAQPAVIEAASNYGSLPAFQVNNWLASSNAGSACGGTVTEPVPCDDTMYLQMLQEGIYPLGLSNSLRSQYIEVWETNANVFTNAIWQAHQQIFTPP